MSGENLSFTRRSRETSSLGEHPSIMRVGILESGWWWYNVATLVLAILNFKSQSLSIEQTRLGQKREDLLGSGHLDFWSCPFKLLYHAQNYLQLKGVCP